VIARATSLATALLLSLAAAPALGAQPAAAPRDGGGVAGVAPGLVDGATARKLVARGVKVVDVRTPAEFSAGHVPGAVNIPHDQMASRHAELGPPSTPVLLYCRSGRRTEIAARALRERGFSTIYDLQSYDRWVASEPKR
jgi:rhodanese-related sulfurtransferase